MNKLTIKLRSYSGIFFGIIFLIAGCKSGQNNQKDTAIIYEPDRDLGQLFDTVQTSNIFDDYKTFVDCTPKKDPAEIVKDYESQKTSKGFNLKKFVLANFNLPPTLEKKAVDKNTEMIPHLKNLWTYLTRTAETQEKYTTLISLPEPFIVPGGRFREMFYWDSYFSMIGLLESNKDELAYGMLKNFEFLIKKYGFIPNGNRTYFASRSQPPFFAEMLALYADKHGMKSVIEFLPSLEREYQFWTADESKANELGHSLGRTVLLGNAVLNRYNGTLTTPRAEGYGKEKKWASNLPEADRPKYYRNLRAVCESGWDFSSRWFADGKNKITTNCEDIVPICLNSILYGMEKQLSVMYKYQGELDKVQYYEERASMRKQAMQTYLWSPEDGYFKDYNFVKEEQTHILSLATLYPLYFGVASQSQANQIAKVVVEQLLFNGGVVTTTLNTGEQWDYPYGWAPLQWITVVGLAKYGHQKLACKIALRWLRLNEKVYHQEGKMMEKYNVVDTTQPGGGGSYKNQDGFGWTNGVALGLQAFLNRNALK